MAQKEIPDSEYDNIMKKFQEIAFSHNIIKTDGVTFFLNIINGITQIVFVNVKENNTPMDIQTNIILQYNNINTGFNVLKETISKRLDKFENDNIPVSVIKLKIFENYEEEKHFIYDNITVKRQFFDDFFEKK